MTDAVVALPAIGRHTAAAEILTPAEMLAQAEALVGSPAGAGQSEQGRTDSPPTDGMPTDPALAAQRELVASLGKAVADAATEGSNESSADWLTRREVQAQRMAERVKARKMAAEEAEAAQQLAQKMKAQRKREQVRRRAEKKLREAEAATPTTALLGTMIDGQAQSLPGVTALRKEQRLWGGNNGKGQVKGLLTRKLEAAKARQQATAARMKEQAKRQAETRTRLVAALALAESATPGALPPLEDALKAGLREQLAEDSVVLRARELVNEAKQQAKAASKAKARAAAEEAAAVAAQAAAAAAATAAAEQAAHEAVEAEAALVAAARVKTQLQSSAATVVASAAAAGTPVRVLPRQLSPELDCRSPRALPHPSAMAADSTPVRAVPSVGIPPRSVAMEQRPIVADDSRSKLLWQATEAELLAELLRRQQAPQQPAPVVAASRIAVPLVDGSPDASNVVRLTAAGSKLSPLAQSRKGFAKEQADAEAAKAEKAAEIKRKEILEKKLLDKAARAEERKRQVDAKQKAKVEQAQARHEAAQARVRARREAEAEAVAVETDERSAGTEGGDASSAARTQPAADTHAADMRRQMLQARAAGAAAKVKLAQETAAAEQLQKDLTSIDENGVKWRTRPDGTKVKIVRKACPEGEELRIAVQEMATEAGWSEHKLISRLSGFQGDEQGYRSIWLLLRKEQKTKAKLDKLKTVQTNVNLEVPDGTEQDIDLQLSDELQDPPESTKQDAVQDNKQSTLDGENRCCDKSAAAENNGAEATERKPWHKGRKALIPKPWKRKTKKTDADGAAVG